MELDPEQGPVDLQHLFQIALPEDHDVWISVVALGAERRLPWWDVENLYTLGATNPVWVDRDAEPGYQSPRETARQRIARAGPQPARLVEALEAVDDAVLVQALTLVSTDQLAALDELVGSRATQSETLRAFLGGR